jgi:endonuclease/exonuclease/phosphatase family metal-dependent hydrolase
MKKFFGHGLVALGLLFSLDFVTVKPASANTSVPFRSISYNVWGLPVPFKLNHDHLEKIQRSLFYYEPDVVALQETFTKRSRVFESTPGLPYFAYGPGKGKGKPQNSGLMTLSKHPIVKTKHLKFNKCSGFDCLSAKGVLLTTIELPGGRQLDIYNTHLNAGKNKKSKWSQIKQVVEFIKENSTTNAYVVHGDFNITPDSEYYTYLLDQDIFHDTHKVYVDNNPQLSEREKTGITHRTTGLIKKKQKERKLDYIFSSDSAVNFSRVIYDGTHDDNRYSDHYALLVDQDI